MYPVFLHAKIVVERGRMPLRREKITSAVQRVRASICKNFRFATLDMVFILIFVNVFQAVFGMENSIVGVIFTILMAASMARDLTSRPVKHFLTQAFVLILMATAASFVGALGPLAALPINLAMIFLILYAFTYEYASHLYFPYILSYLFLVFISPVTPEQLPKRLAGVLTGAVCVMLYQFIMGGHRVHDVVRSSLTGILDEAEDCIRCLLEGKGKPDDPEQVRENLCELIRIVYERRKRVLCVSDASFAAIDAGRGLEHLILLLYGLEGSVTPERENLLREILLWLEECRMFLEKKKGEPPVLKRECFVAGSEDQTGEEFFRALIYLRKQLVRMTQRQERTRYQKTALSFWVRCKAALNLSQVRVVYALRVAVLLALSTFAVQALQLPHGKWLLFTVASVSLPYAEDVGGKAKKRFAATLIGTLISLLVFSLVPSVQARSLLMMLSGYLSFYFSGYTGTFACSTVGALGGAVYLSSFGWGQVGGIIMIRIGYVAVGILLAWIANCVVLPYRRKNASAQLWKKYGEACGLLVKVCRQENADKQLYYSLVIQVHLMEEKLCQNSKAAGWDGMQELLSHYRRQVREAHRGRYVPA